jgi:hypothetical protein
MGALFLALLIPATGIAADPWLSGDFQGVHLVMEPDAPEPVQAAANVFARYWGICSDKKVSQSPVNQGRINVWLDGERAVAEGLLDQEVWENLLPGQFVVKSFKPSIRERRQGVGRHLVLAGESTEATVHAVFAFLDRMANVRWLAPGEVDAPRLPLNMAPFDFSQVSPFQYRGMDIHGWRNDSAHAEWRWAHKLSNPEDPWTTSGYWTPVHPVFPILGDPEASQGDAISAEDPETAVALATEISALVTSNPQDRGEVEQTKRKKILWHGLGGARSDYVVVNLSGLDWIPLEAVESEEAPDIWMRLVNRVADELQQRMPDSTVRVNTLMFGPCRRVPDQVQPAENVIVTLSTLGCDLGKPVGSSGSPENVSFVEDLAAWSDVDCRLHILDFLGNVAMPQRLLPNLFHLQANLRLYDQYGVSGVHLAALETTDPSHLAWGSIQAYIGARLLWDPDFIFLPVLEDFMQRYYGPGGQPIIQAIQALTAAAEASDKPAQPEGDLDWLTPEDLAEVEQAFQAAFPMPLTDVQRRRAAVAHLPIRYAAARIEQSVPAKLPAVLQLGLDQYREALRLYVLPGNRGRAEALATPLLTEFDQPRQETVTNEE